MLAYVIHMTLIKYFAKPKAAKHMIKLSIILYLDDLILYPKPKCETYILYQGGDEPYTFSTYGEIVIVPDPEIAMENLVENKHHKLARSLRSGPTDRDMKPDARTRDNLNVSLQI